MNIKTGIIDLLTKLDDGEFSNIAINKFFKSSNFNEKEKSFITEVFYGVIRKRIFLDYIINKFSKKIKKKKIFYLMELSVYQIFFMNSDSKGVIWEAVEITKKKYSNALSGFVNGLLRNIDRNKEEILKKLEEDNEEAILYSYPDWVLNLIKEEYKSNYLDVLKSYKTTPKISVRVNKLKYNEEEFEKYLNSEKYKILNKIDTVYYLDSGRIINTALFREGKIIVQDASSYLAAKYLDPKSGEEVLDCCAAPGSKTMVLAELMENKGKIIALDIYEHKLNLINNNAEKLNIDIIDTQILDARKIKSLDKMFDKVLLDLPCSGFGVLRKKPEVLYNKTKETVLELAKLQKEILEEVSKVLKKDGSMIYSTCTIFKEENIENIKWFLENNKNFVIEKLDLPENVNGFIDELGGLNIDYTEKFLDSFYIIKVKRVS